MNIGIDASQANKRERTGTEWYAFSILSEWIRSGSFTNHTVILYTREQLSSDFPALPDNWKVRVLHWPPRIFWTQFRLSFELLFHRVDALFVPSHAIPFIHPHKTFTTIHDIGFEVAPEVYPKKSVVHINSRFVQACISCIIRIVTFGKYGGSELDYHKFSVRYALHNAFHIFTVSKFTQHEIERRFPSHPNISVAYNGIPTSEFFYPYPDDTIHRVVNSFGLSSPYILSIGRVEMKKNSLALVQSFHTLLKNHPNQNITLVFAGSDGAGAPDVHAYVRMHNLSKKIRFLGWIPQNTIAPLLAGASVFAFFSEYEGFGVPLIQSLAVGTPVVANDLEIFHELVGDSVTYCDAHNVETASEALYHSILQQKGRVEEGVQKAQSFRWSDTAKKIESVISENLAK